MRRDSETIIIGASSGKSAFCGGGSREIPNSQAYAFRQPGGSKCVSHLVSFSVIRSRIYEPTPIQPSYQTSSMWRNTFMLSDKHNHGRKPILLRLLVHDRNDSTHSSSRRSDAWHHASSHQAEHCLQGVQALDSFISSAQRNALRLRCLEKLGHTCLGFSWEQGDTTRHLDKTPLINGLKYIMSSNLSPPTQPFSLVQTQLSPSCTEYMRWT